METPLTEEQQQLLSAWLDGEVTDAEKQTAEQLLEREDAKQYVESLRGTIALVTKHGAVRAPVGLSGRVLGALEDEFKPQAADPGSDPFTSMPAMSWRTPLYAAAAAIIVSLAIMFGPSLFGPSEASSGGVARTALDNLPSGRQGAQAQRPGQPEEAEKAVLNETPAAERLNHDERDDQAKMQDALEELQRDEDNTGRPANSWDGKDNYRKAKDEAKDLSSPKPGQGAQKENEEKQDLDAKKVRSGVSRSKLKVGEVAGGGAGEAKHGEPTEDGSPARYARENAKDKATTKGDSTPANTATPGPGKASPDPQARGDRKRDQGRRNESGEKAPESNNAPVPPEQPAPANPDAPKDSPAADAKDASDSEDDSAATDIEISDAHTLAAQTDVLWVSNLYGDAGLADASGDELENVTVEVDADKLPELLAALRKLADDQGYGKVKGGETPAEGSSRVGMGGSLRGNADKVNDHRIGGYLPPKAGKAPTVQAKKTHAASEPAPKGNAPTTGAEKRAAKRVKLVIRLK